VILLARGRETVACQTVSVPPLPPQTWNSPVSSESPPAWLVDQAPPDWVTEHAKTENWPEDGIATWQAAFVETGVRAVTLTHDVRGGDRRSQRQDHADLERRQRAAAAQCSESPH